MADHTGIWLKDFMDQNGIQPEEVLIKSSPMVRCLQTAASIAVKAGVKEIHTDFRFIELLTDYYLPIAVDKTEVSIVNEKML